MCKGKANDKTKSNYIKQVGPAFFTKVFYFMSKAFPPKNAPIPLILDNHMMYIHCALLLEEQQAKQSYYKWYKPKKGKEGIVWRKQDSKFVADVYINYINKMHIISQKISCSTDALESYLFDLKPGKKGSSIYEEVKETINIEPKKVQFVYPKIDTNIIRKATITRTKINIILTSFFCVVFGIETLFGEGILF